MAGRPSLIDDARVREIIISAISLGSSYKAACDYAGISYHTFTNWMRKGRADVENGKNTKFAQFFHDIKKAESDAYMRALSAIVEAYTGGTWQAAAWYLERRYPEEFGKRRLEISGLDGGSISVNASVGFIKLSDSDVIEASKIIKQSIFGNLGSDDGDEDDRSETVEMD